MWSSIDEMEIKQNDIEDIWVLLIQKRLGWYDNCSMALHLRLLSYLAVKDGWVDG